MTTITKAEQFVWDWQYRKLGDSFLGKLADLIAKSDNMNRTELLKAFPEYVQAITDFQSKDGWWDEVDERIQSNTNKKYFVTITTTFTSDEMEIWAKDTDEAEEIAIDDHNCMDDLDVDTYAEVTVAQVSPPRIYK